MFNVFIHLPVSNFTFNNVSNNYFDIRYFKIEIDGDYNYIAKYVLSNFKTINYKIVNKLIIIFTSFIHRFLFRKINVNKMPLKTNKIESGGNLIYHIVFFFERTKKRRIRGFSSSYCFAVFCNVLIFFVLSISNLCL